MHVESWFRWVLNPRLYSEGRRTLGKEVVVSRQVTGMGGFSNPSIRQEPICWMKLRPHWQIRIRYWCARRGDGGGRVQKVVDLEWRMESSPEPKNSPADTQHQTSPSQMSGYFKFYPQQLLVRVFNGSSPLFSFYTWTHPPPPTTPPPVYLSCSSLQYMVTRRSLCAAATPCLERSPKHNAEVRVYLSYTSLSQASLLLALLIRLLYMLTYTTAERMIMSLAHVVAGAPRGT